MEHISTLTSISCLANCYTEMKKYELAIQLQEKCVIMKRRVIGHSNTSTIISMKSLANVLKFNKQYEKASFHWAEIASIYRAQKNIDLLLPALTSLASCLQLVPTLTSDTVNVLKELVSLTRTHKGSMSKELCNPLKHLATALKADNQIDSAKSYYIEHAELKTTLFGTSHMETSIAWKISQCLTHVRASR